MSDAQNLSDLQWAHETLVRLVPLIQRKGLLGQRLEECLTQICHGIVLLDGVIQEFASHARRRKDD